MLVEKLEHEVRQIISEIIEIEVDKISLDARFVEDIGMDSMMALEILAALERKYKITIPEDELPRIKTLRDTLEIVKSHVK